RSTPPRPTTPRVPSRTRSPVSPPHNPSLVTTPPPDRPPVVATTTGPDDPPSGAAPGRRRPPPARLSPPAMADARGGPGEGVAWRGRSLEAKGCVLYGFLRLVGRSVLFGLFRFRMETSGREHLPRGGYLIVGAAHRGWMAPFVVIHALPVQPRAWFL